MPVPGEFVANRLGIEQLLVRPETEMMLKQRAEHVAIAARARGVMVENQTIEVPIEVLSDIGIHRARAAVSISHPSGLAVEAKYALLTTALDAARW